MLTSREDAFAVVFSRGCLELTRRLLQSCDYRSCFSKALRLSIPPLFLLSSDYCNEMKVCFTLFYVWHLKSSLSRRTEITGVFRSCALKEPSLSSEYSLGEICLSVLASLGISHMVIGLLEKVKVTLPEAFQLVMWSLGSCILGLSTGLLHLLKNTLGAHANVLHINPIRGLLCLSLTMIKM